MRLFVQAVRALMEFGGRSVSVPPTGGRGRPLLAAVALEPHWVQLGTIHTFGCANDHRGSKLGEVLPR